MEVRYMPKAYWVCAYRSVQDEEALLAYSQKAIPAVLAAGGRIVARGIPAKVYENGLAQRIVLIEFPSVAQAISAHESASYQEALALLGATADRDLRIIEGV